MIPRKGAEVARITEKDLRDVLEVRTSLEKLAIELACDRITEDDIYDLKLACKNFEESFGKDDLTTIAEKDVAFHDIMYSHTVRCIDKSSQKNEECQTDPDFE